MRPLPPRAKKNAQKLTTVKKLLLREFLETGIYHLTDMYIHGGAAGTLYQPKNSIARSERLD